MTHVIAYVDDGPRDSWLLRKAGLLHRSGRTFDFVARLQPEQEYGQGVDIPIRIHEAVLPSPTGTAGRWILRGLLAKDLDGRGAAWKKGRPIVVTYDSGSKRGTLHSWSEAMHLGSDALAELADSPTASASLAYVSARTGHTSTR